MKKPVMVLITGVVLLVGGVAIGLGDTIIGMIHSFNGAAAAAPGTVSPDKLAGEIGHSLISLLIGIPVSFAGLLLVIGGTIAHLRSKPGTETQKTTA